MEDSAELFEAISHPERIRILKILRKQPSSFASLKRQLGIRSSGNLDHHLKKLGRLVTVREDGLYGLTDAGKEALLSIEATETWTETEKRKTKMAKMPKEAVFLGLLELCTTASIFGFLFFLTIIRAPFIWENLWGYVFFAALLLIGFSSGLGMFIQWKGSWTMALAKSALIISMSLFLLNYAADQPSVEIYYSVFVVAEIAAVIVTLRHPLKDFLGIINRVKMSILVIIGSFFCMFSGILLILLENWKYFPVETPQLGTPAFAVFISIFDPSILCGLLIIVGGVLILLRSKTLGAAISIIFGLFPPYPYANHAWDIILGTSLPSLNVLTLFAAVVGSLPIIGGFISLASERKIRG